MFHIGRGREITPGFLPSALRAALRAFKIAPGDFVELPTSCSQSRRATRLRYTPKFRSRRTDINHWQPRIPLRCIRATYYKVFPRPSYLDKEAGYYALLCERSRFARRACEIAGRVPIGNKVLVARTGYMRESASHATVRTSMPAQIIDGKQIAAEIRESVREGIAERIGKGHRAPGLAVVLVGEDHASQVYVRKKREACEHAGIVSVAYDLPADTSEHHLLALIEELNNTDTIDGKS